jgi:hypothetical protein
VKRYLLRTDGVSFEVSRRPEPRLDDRGVQKIDRATGLPSWGIELLASISEDEGSSVMTVAVPSRTAPVLAWRQPVEVVDLEIVPWAQKGRRDGELRQGVAYRAAEIRPLDHYDSGAVAA